MASAAAMSDIETYLATVWTSTPIKRVQGEMDADFPADGSAWLAVEYDDVREETWSFGSPGYNSFEEVGRLRLINMVPKGTDVEAATEAMDELVAEFRQPAVFGTSSLTRTEIVMPSSAPVDMGTYFGIAAIILFRRRFAG